MSEINYQAHPTAVIDDEVSIGKGTRIWHFCHVCSGAQIGSKCSLGQNVMVAENAIIGDNVKIQNNVVVYSGVTVEDDAFLGPSCVFTNISNPRSQVSRKSLYEKTLVRRGATVGANATIVSGITLGRYAFVAAGSVITKDVPDYGFIVGTPGRMIGHMSRHGHRLIFDNAGFAACPEFGLRYEKVREVVHCLDFDECDPLPDELTVGTREYQDWKKENS